MKDERRWQQWVDTGAYIDHDSMMAWLDGLAVRADHVAKNLPDLHAPPPAKATDAELPAESAIEDKPGAWS